MQKPRDIKRSRIIVALSVIVGFWVLNLFAQIFWGFIFMIAEPLTGAFGSGTGYYSYEFQFIGPVILALVAVGIYTLIAYSPIGISMAKSKAGIRPIMTEQEKGYLEPLHDEVFDAIKEKFPDAKKKKLYMFDSPDINAFCMNQGSDIALHRGSIQALNTEELKAVLAHEYAHAYYNDGLYSTMYAGSAFMLPYVFFLPFLINFNSFMGIVGTGNIFAWGFAILIVWLIVKFWIFLMKIALFPVLFAVNLIVGMFEKQVLEAGQKFKEAGLIVWLIVKFWIFLMKIALFPVLFAVNLIVGMFEKQVLEAGQKFKEAGTYWFIQNIVFMMMSKEQEYRADEFACYVGYKYGMQSALAGQKFKEAGTYWFIQNIVFMMMSKEQEYRADEFACYVGYKYGMQSALNLFYSMDFQPVYGVMNRLLAEHPSNPKRIANVESFDADSY